MLSAPMTVTSSRRTLIPHTESKRKAPRLLVLESLTNGSWFIESSLPEIFLYFHIDTANAIAGHAVLLCAHTCLFAISTTGCVLKRPEDENPMLQKPDFANSQSHFDAWKKAVKWSVFSYDAYSDNMHGINWRTEKNLFLSSGIPPHTVALLFSPGKTVSGFASVKAPARNKNIMLQDRNIKAQFKFLYW